MIDKNDPEWKKWHKYVEKKYDTILEQMDYYKEENLPFTRQIAAEMGVEFTPNEVKSYANLIKYTMDIITSEKNTQRETPDQP